MTPNSTQIDLLGKHFRGELVDGTQFVYCPVGKIVSWYFEDYNHKWCHHCQKFFDEIKINGNKTG